MTNRLLFYFFLLFATKSIAQNCECSAVLATYIQKTEANYAGFQDKVTPQTRPRYQQLVDSLRTAAKNLPGDKHCYQLVRAYKRFFKDGHFQISFQDPNSVVPVRTLDMDESKAKAYFDSHAKSLHPLEGIWAATDGSYRVATIRDPAQSTKVSAVVLAARNKNWKVGMVKFEALENGKSPYTGLYWAGDLSSSERTFPLDGNVLNIPNSGYWIREYPQRATPEEVAKTQQSEEEFYVKLLNPQTFYVRIPSFGITYEIVDSVMQQHHAVLAQTPHLIIDIRDNGGGTNSSFPALLKYLNTSNFKNVGSRFRSTPDNLLAETKIIERASAEGWVTEKEVKVWRETVAENQRKVGQMVEYPVDSIAFNEVMPYPQKVAVLMNENCYSSAEYFVFYAKQSKKVTLFGNHTGGMMDYGNVRNHPLPCEAFELRLPTTRTGWVDYAPIDNVGFLPDVPISNAEKDWVKFVQNYWKSK